MDISVKIDLSNDIDHMRGDDMVRGKMRLRVGRGEARGGLRERKVGRREKGGRSKREGKIKQLCTRKTLSPRECTLSLFFPFMNVNRVNKSRFEAN